MTGHCSRGAALIVFLSLLALAGATAASAVPTGDTLSVFCAGASRASVYVASLAKVPGAGSGGYDLPGATFAKRYYRGQAPYVGKLEPGQYVVSVMPSLEYNMAEAMRQVGMWVWDGYDQHAVVLMPETDSWRYAHCYLVTKEANQPLAVFAVFANRGEPDQCLTYPPGGSAPKFTAGDD